jgi:cobalamin-dependent methionine synthase I
LLVIGELINSSRRQVRDALESRNAALLLEMARRQKESGAHYVDVNCSALGPNEAACLRWLIPLLQDNLDVQVSLDSPNVPAILDALSLAKGQPILNSVTADSPELGDVFAAARDRTAKVIGLCLSGASLPASSDETRANGERLLSKAAGASFPLHDLFLDPLVRAISTCGSSCRLFLDSLAAVKHLSSNARTVCGLSNISFGMPARRSLNRAFLPLAIMQGLDAVILDPTDRELMGILHASRALADPETGVTEYLAAFRNGLVPS